MRFSKKNMILWGVWQAKGKPVFQTFLQPFIEEMEKMKTEGFTLDIDGNKISVRAMLLAGTMDLQAKAYITEMTQHNGHFGCLSCEHPGKVVNQGKGHARVYPPMDCPQRTTEGLIENAREASGSSRPVKGIKGVSTLLGLEWFNIIDGLGPDYMHGVLLGVTKKLLQLLFSPTFSKQPYSIASQIKEVDKRLKRMKPTDAIGRLPRALENNIHHMKASELQNWLLFYSVPCLIDYMDKKYLDHFVLFVEGIYILLCDGISDQQIERAEFVLYEFYKSFAELYGENNCTLNLHNACCHLPHYVKLLGPLWSWSCFPFENMNGNILNCVHGTGDVCLQVLWVSQAQKRLAVDSNMILEPELKTFADRMTATKRSVKVTNEVSNCKIIGGTGLREISEDVKSKVAALVLQDPGKLLFPSRVFVKDTIFYSNDYERHSKRICTYVLVNLNDEPCVAIVDRFIYHQDKNVCFAVIRKVSMNEQEPLVHPYVHHLLKIKAEPDVVEHVVMVDQLLEKVMFLNGNKAFACVARLPNLHGLCS